ncbi:MAG TPA: hypothetical protein PKJ33_03180 [Alphaproteobacteria bacterium]|nr:hypothetical protein [Alphaproteobacteria bacterium]
MKTKIFGFLSLALCLCAGAANANWEYSGERVGDGWYRDDGSRLILSFRGGAAFAKGSVNNDINSLTAGYYVNTSDGTVISEAYYNSCVDAGGCSGYSYAGLGDISKLKAAKDFSKYSFAAGASVGWTIPNSPQWRMEFGWDRISETEYNSAPLFSGNLKLTGGSVSGLEVKVDSGGAYSTLNTNIISAMAFYDFFDGVQKPLHQMIPYVGFGIGYADMKTTLDLADLYGDLSTSLDLQNYGKLDTYSVLQFYKSEKTSSSVAGLLALGFSYGLMDNMFLDLGARLMYVPEIKYTISNEDATKSRDWFSVKSMLYTNIMAGVRFEF